MDQRFTPWLAFFVVGLAFWAAYLSIGLQLSSHHIFHNDVLFHSDLQRVMIDMTLFDVKHKRTNVHPLFVLLTNPIGVTLAYFTGSLGTAAVILNSFIGGACVAMTGRFLVMVGIPLFRALLFSLILGCSTAHLFFGTAPETYALSALSIILFFSLSYKHPGEWRYLVPAGILSFGVLITNLAIVTLGYGSSLLNFSQTYYQKMRLVIGFVLMIVGIGALLAGVQKLIWPQSVPFFVPATYTGESNFVKVPSKSRAFTRREGLLIRHIWAFDWFAPATVISADAKREVRVRFESERLGTIPVSGRMALTLWFALLAASAFAFVRYRLYLRPLPIGIVASLIFNFALHTLYGDDFFLYSCNTGFLLLAWAAICTAEFSFSLVRGRIFDSGLLILLGLEIANNGRFVLALLEVRHS